MASLPDQGPFHYDGPIREREQFFGRSAVVSDVLYYLLEHGQSISVIGEEKAGKTSFLFHVSCPETIAEVAMAYGFTPRDNIFVYVNCESLRELGEARCFRWIRDALNEQILAHDERFTASLNRILPSGAYAELCDVLRILKRATVRLIVELDDFEWLADNSRLSYRFFNGLRALTNNHDVSYLVASRVPLNELERRAPSIAGSRLFNIFLSCKLLPFDPGEGREFLGSQLASVDVVLPETMQNLIFELSQYEPYRLQLAGACACDLWCKNAGELNESHNKELELRFNELFSSGSLSERKMPPLNSQLFAVKVGRET